MHHNDVRFIHGAFFHRSEVRDPRYSFRHALSTSALIYRYGRRTREMTPESMDRMGLAALGHDLLEDTGVSAQEIATLWGPLVLELIEGLTNRVGDDDMAAYLEHLASADDEVVLVKMADILSNLAGSIRSSEQLGPKWFVEFWIPLLHAYQRVLFPRRLARYPATMGAMVHDASAMLRTAECQFTAVRDEVPGKNDKPHV